MIILNRLEKFASQAGYFSEMQFGFQEGSGCIEASFAILFFNLANKKKYNTILLTNQRPQR